MSSNLTGWHKRLVAVMQRFLTRFSVNLCALVPPWCPFLNHQGTKARRDTEVLTLKRKYMDIPELRNSHVLLLPLSETLILFHFQQLITILVQYADNEPPYLATNNTNNYYQNWIYHFI